MPIVERDEFSNFLMETIPGRKRRVEEEPDPDPLNGNAIDLIRLTDSVRGAGRDLYPTDPLTGEQYERYAELANRNDRLRPIDSFQYGELGTGRIPGNPFSIDTRGAARGVGNLIVGLVNRARDKRRGEFEGELSGLSDQQRENIENEERQQKFFEDAFPGLITQEGQTIRNREDNERMREEGAADRASQERRTQAEIEGRQERDKIGFQNEAQAREEEQAFERELENLQAENDRKLQKMKNLGGGGSGGSGGLTGSERQEIAESLTIEGNVLEEEIGRLNKISSNPYETNAYNSGRTGPYQTLEQEIDAKVKRLGEVMKERARINLDLARGIEPDTDSDNGKYDPPPN